jgi:predicted DNA-binding transcriptional regulator YafY
MRLRPPSRAPRRPRVGRPEGRFTQHRNLARLRDALEASPAGLELRDLAVALGISQRSVRRYLGELHRVTEVESVPTVPGGVHLWRIKPSERGRAVSLRRSQAYLLLFARRVYDVLRGSALYDEVDVAMRQILQLAQRPVRIGAKGEIPHEGRLEDRMLFLGPQPRAYAARGEELDHLFQAVAELRVLRLRYRRRAAEKPERMTLHPYAMFAHDGALHCVGLHVESGRVDALSFDKMSDLVSFEDERFVLPEDLEPESFLHGELGVATPAQGSMRVLVEFDARVADQIKSRRVHPTQRLATAPDGRVRLSFVAPDNDRLRAWILAFGDAARVVAPEGLAAELSETLERARNRYG